MSSGNKKKAEQLGMSHGAACNKLKKSILFGFVQDAGLDICYRCGEQIESVDKLSIEHKIPWMDSNNPVKLFFDLENIAFSHLHCNSITRRTSGPQARQGPEETAWCSGCQDFRPIKLFGFRLTKNQKRRPRGYCNECRKKRRDYRKSLP